MTKTTVLLGAVLAAFAFGNPSRGKTQLAAGAAPPPKPGFHANLMCNNNNGICMDTGPGCTQLRNGGVVGRWRAGDIATCKDNL
ncbi:MAG: hypothetical protein R3F56_23080 [Planctomycetota bacterium]